MAMRDVGIIPEDRKVASGDKVEIVVGTAIRPGEFARLGPTYGSYERAWRQVTEKHKGLQGTDYHQKDELEAEKMEELGYEPNYQKDLQAGYDYMERELMN